ncbi:hypothetical protein CC86DRAFT_367963 [Ophiobolus disseminans]|uniref:GDP-mannose transporter n=1 Tax=Ophiobolus disseminans TaxID=1469910 RepID=A0A6A7ABK2_9PLEO|nr:hypothetical protein CC86DRAFT_367963 [Ophiobolus disseminans]
MERQPGVELVGLGNRRTISSNTTQSDDEDNGESQIVSSIRPLMGRDTERGGSLWKRLFKQGGLGEFFLGSSLGWHLWVGLLVFWSGGCSFGLLLMNRFIMLTGIYKIPWPLSHTYVQLLLTHFILATWSAITRWLASPLKGMGFGAAVAPHGSLTGALRGLRGKRSSFMTCLFDALAGIAGGGILGFEFRVAKQVFPLAVVFVAKVLLSNYSFAYTTLPVYQLARIGVVPVAMVFSSTLQKNSYSYTTFSSALIATIYLLVAILQFPRMRVIWESIAAGIISSLFSALYPILLLRTHRAIMTDLIPQGHMITEEVSYGVETRAYYRTLHYVSFLSIMILTPIVLLSGELPYIYHNIPFLDVPFFLMMIWCGGLGSFAVFSSTLLLVKATSPFTTIFINTPRSAFQLAMINFFKIPKYSWGGILLCWLSSLWYLYIRRSEGQVNIKRRIYR